MRYLVLTKSIEREKGSGTHLILPKPKLLENAKTSSVQTANQAQKREELKKACGSELERTVLQRIADEGLPLPDEAQHIIYNGDIRIAKPDFYYKQQNIALFIDGPPHGEDYVKKDDEEKRKKLRTLGYRVFVIHHSDISQGIDRLKEAL